MDRVPGTEASRPQGGFTLVELLVALIILAVGLLGLAGTTGFVVRQTGLAKVTTQRSIARQSVIESLRAQSYGSVGSGTDDIGSMQVSWSVVNTGAISKTVEVVTTGPGLETRGGVPTMSDQVADTFYFERMDY